MKSKGKQKELEQTRKAERTGQFVQERNSQLERRECTRQQCLSKNRTLASDVKEKIATGMERIRRTEQMRLERQRARKEKERLERSVLANMHDKARLSNSKDRIKEKLDMERCGAQTSGKIVFRI